MSNLKEMLDKIFPSVPYDKKLHFVAGLLVSLLCGYLTSPLTGIVICVIAGIGKEVYDYIDYGKPDVWDMIATWTGGLTGYILLEILK